MRERGQANPARAPFEQPPREPQRVDDRGGDTPSRETLYLAVEEGHVEARVVGHEHRVAREAEEAAHGPLRRRRAAKRPAVDPGQRRDRSGQRHVGVDERLEPLLELEVADPDRSDLADPGAPRP